MPQYLSNAVKIRFVAQSISFTKPKSLEKTSIFLIMKYKSTIKNSWKKVIVPGKLGLYLFLVIRGNRFHSSVLETQQHILCKVTRLFLLSNIQLALTSVSEKPVLASCFTCYKVSKYECAEVRI